MKVVNLNSDAYDVYIGRPSKWGNPFSHLDDSIAEFKVANRTEAITKYKSYILSTPELLYSLHELDGKVLGCHCKPLPCHGDILIQLRHDQLSEELL